MDSFSIVPRSQQEFVKKFIRFNSYTQARDKYYRLIQYSTKCLLWYMEHRLHKDVNQLSLKSLEESVSVSRKLFRLFQSVDFINRMKSSLSLKDDVEMLSILLSMFGKSCWLMLDHLLWAYRVKIIEINSPRVSLWSNRFWLLGILGSVTTDIRRLQILMYKHQKLKASLVSSAETDQNSSKALRSTFETRRLELIRDLLDLLIPLSNLGWINSGFGGFAGVASTVIGFKLEWQRINSP